MTSWRLHHGCFTLFYQIFSKTKTPWDFRVRPARSGKRTLHSTWRHSKKSWRFVGSVGSALGTRTYFLGKPGVFRKETIGTKTIENYRKWIDIIDIDMLQIFHQIWRLVVTAAFWLIQKGKNQEEQWGLTWANQQSLIRDNQYWLWWLCIDSKTDSLGHPLDGSLLFSTA